jgi:hypothetical protein
MSWRLILTSRNPGSKGGSVGDASDRVRDGGPAVERWRAGGEGEETRFVNQGSLGKSSSAGAGAEGVVLALVYHLVA